MPLTRTIEICRHTTLGVWHDSPTPHAPSYTPKVLARVKNMCETRRKETLAIYSLLSAMTGNDGLEIGHEESGKPFIAGQPHTHIGISHTKGFASIIVSSDRNVAVDIEYRSTRIMKIADRFLRNDEKADCSEYINGGGGDTLARQDLLLIVWCAKEAMYKYYSDEALTFQNMRISMPPMTPEANACGKVEATNILNGEHKTIDYIIDKDYVLTYLY